jgi:hypothetical protein
MAGRHLSNDGRRRMRLGPRRRTATGASVPEIRQSAAAPDRPGQTGWSPGGTRLDEAAVTLGDLIDAVLQCGADSREAAIVIEDLLVTGRIHLTRQGP